MAVYLLLTFPRPEIKKKHGPRRPTTRPARLQRQTASSKQQAAAAGNSWVLTLCYSVLILSYWVLTLYNSVLILYYWVLTLYCWALILYYWVLTLYRWVLILYY